MSPELSRTTDAGHGLLVHEWIEQIGGSENVLDEFARIFPGTDILSLWNNAPERYTGHRVLQSRLARTPIRRSKALALPASAVVWRTLGLHASYDWMLVSSHAFAHHARVRSVPADRKFVYVHSPARYLWVPDLDERGQSRAVRAVAPAFRALDRHRAQETVHFAANSAYVARRIEDSWQRPARVIHPPVRVAELQQPASWRGEISADEARVLDGLPDEFLLGASRFIPYKQLDLVIRAGEASGLPVVLAGRGPLEAELRALAADASIPVHFVISPSDEMLFALYESAAALVFPALEDFGIMPVEAMALGTPVVSRNEGGVVESVRDGVSGTHVEEWTPTVLKAAVQRAVGLDRAQVRASVQRFDSSRFRDQISTWVLGT
ncbi:glycosyltransferase [Flexivirga sp. B27]